MRRSLVMLLAVAGLALAAGVTYAAGRLVSQPIGLTGEPATLGESLAPDASSRTTTATTPRSDDGTSGTSTERTTPDDSHGTTTKHDDDHGHRSDDHDEDD